MQSKQLHTIDPLFDFQILCDTDLGLYRLIKRDYYCEDSIFEDTLFESRDERFIRTMLLCRKNFNPLFLFCKEGIMKDEELDDLYKQFLDEEYDKILELSPPTSIMSIASVSNSVQRVVNITVLCANKSEVQWINKYDDQLNCIIGQYKDFNINPYDTIYIKDLYTLLLFRQDTIDLKNIIIPRFVFNLEIASQRVELPLVEVTQKYYKRNKFMVADPYKGITIPSSEMQ